MEGTPLSKACEWLAVNPSESTGVISKIFKVPRSTIQSRIARVARPRPHGGQNRVLTIA
jgi:hypothetical protein